MAGLEAPDPKFVPQWSDFKTSVPARLALPIYQFRYSLQYVPIALEPEQRRHAMNIFMNAIVDALKTEPDSSLSALNLVLNPKELIEPDQDKEEAYFAISYGSPVFDFALHMGPTTLAITKLRTTLPNLVRVTPIFSRITEVLAPHPNSSPQDPNHSFLAEAGIKLDHVSLTFRWDHHLVLGTHLGDEIDANNVELLQRLVRFGGDTPSQLRPFSSMQLDAIRRGEIKIGFTKNIASRPRKLWIHFDGPWNVTRQDVDLDFSYSLGDPDSPMHSSDLFDFRTPFVSFYRDEILKGFLADLFSNVHIAGRQY